MLSVFDPALSKLVPVGDGPLPTGGWLHLEVPTEAELQRVVAIGLPEELLAHALDEDELARIAHWPDSWSLVVLRVPRVAEADDSVPFRATTLAVLVKDARAITVSRRPSELVNRLMRMPQNVELQRGAHLVPQLLLAAAVHFLELVRVIEHRVEGLEEDLHVSQRNAEVVGLLRYQKALVHFTTAMASNTIMLERLVRDPHLGVRDDDRELMDDAIIELRQAIEMTRIQEEILSQMMDAFASIISNNLNVVMKLLTAMTIVMTIPTMVASFYGMNVELPGQHHPAAFMGVFGASLVASVLLALWFWRKRMF